MTSPPFRTEVQRLRRWCGEPGQLGPRAVLARFGELGQLEELGATRHDEVEVKAVVGHLDPIRSRSSLLSSFAREASPSEPVRTAHAIRWIELGSGITAAGVSRSRRRRVMRPILRGRS